MEIGIVAAVSQNGVIGNKGKLPWRPPAADMERLHSLIDGNVIIVGRHTMDELPQDWDCEYLTISTTRHDCELSPKEALIKARTYWPDKSIYYLGGTRIFQEAFRFASKLYLTRICKDYDGDTKFPLLPSYWELTGKYSISELLIFEEYDNVYGKLPVPIGEV